jgi:putative addiction module component (TIGR02574 family)
MDQRTQSQGDHMGPDVDSIFHAAMSLSEAERIELAARLWEAVSPPLDVPFDEAWEAELERRSDEMSQSESAGTPWEQVRKQKD